VTARRVGLLGGTFDPVHYGHLQLAESAMEEYRLDKVIFIPAAQPPHKNCASVTSFQHRLAMLTLAVQGLKGFECNSIEGKLPKPSYTIDTLQALRKQYQDDCRLFFMIGADAFLDILSWKSYLKILQSVNIILSQRKGYKSEQLADLIKMLGYKKIDRYWSDTNCKKDIYILERTPDKQSSSGIRAMIGKGESVQPFLPKNVIDYIQENKLYQTW